MYVIECSADPTNGFFGHEHIKRTRARSMLGNDGTGHALG